MKKSEWFISELEIKIQELSVKYNDLSPIEKLEVEQYLKTKFQGSMIEIMCGSRLSDDRSTTVPLYSIFVQILLLMEIDI